MPASDLIVRVRVEILRQLTDGCGIENYWRVELERLGFGLVDGGSSRLEAGLERDSFPLF